MNTRGYDRKNRFFFFFRNCDCLEMWKKINMCTNWKRKKHIILVKNIYNIYVRQIVDSCDSTHRWYQVTGFPIFIFPNGINIHVGRMWWQQHVIDRWQLLLSFSYNRQGYSGFEYLFSKTIRIVFFVLFLITLP